jgi:hypothetical protein
MDIIVKRNTRGQDRAQERDLIEKRVVRVLPKNDMIRKYIKHQPSRIGWLKEGSVEWPLDAFTRNRLRDGDVIIETPAMLEQSKKKLTSEQPKSKTAGKPSEPSSHN